MDLPLMATGVALLSLTSSASGPLVPTRLNAVETISELFQFEVEAVSTAKIDPVSVLDKPACVTLTHGDATTRYFHGIVSEFGQLGRTGPLDTQYRLVLVPRLAETGLQHDCRMFFKETAKEILQTLLTEAGVTDVEFRIYSTPPKRDATAQYNETSLHFALRLMEEEGWFFYFEHSAAKHTLVITDANTGFQTIAGASLRYGPGFVSDMLTAWRSPTSITHGKVSLRDYDPDSPSKQLKAEQKTVLKHSGTASRDVFRWPALTRDTAEVGNRAKRQMEAAEARVSLVEGEGALASLVAGGRFTLTEEAGTQTVYVVQQVRHFAEDHARRAGAGASTYSNTFSAFPNAVPWRQPMTTTRPRMEGLHTAIVLAPSGNEIHTDDQGRVKVRFAWDWRQDATADNSPFIRVVQPWAGNEWGGQFIPRVNTEVAIAFMDADPDRPVVLGGFWNGENKPIFPAAQKTKTGFRTRSTLKGGTKDYSEFSFDDDKGNELVFTHAQKDQLTEVENDQTLKVDHDRTVTVKGKETVTIKGDRSHEISEGNESLVVKQGNQTIEVSQGNQALTIKQGNQTVELTMGNQSTTLKQGNQSVVLNMGNQTTDAKLGNISVKADVGSITLEALQSITLKCGQSTFTLSPTGVELKGMQVSVAGQLQTEVKGLMVTTQGSAMLTLKGGITMIN